MNNFEQFKKLRDVVTTYQRDNTEIITQHFPSKTRSLMPVFKVVTLALSAILIVVLLSQKLPHAVNDSGSKSPTTPAEGMNGDNAVKNDETLPIYQVIHQVYSTEFKGYEVTLLSLNLVTIDIVSQEKLVISEYYYWNGERLFKAMYKDQVWMVLKDSEWIELIP